ncbi:unnamed protein product [Cuscuta campestris]|uniref:Uncharacterized protein n=1 Tax=Cuscuta campestris TaxID=132261 RepID=A0A484NKC2_9ASTE|nr:unnamed protein product [Cuscuta campestris]
MSFERWSCFWARASRSITQCPWGISLSHNPNPQKYMVMQYHSVENGFRLPLHSLLRDLCRHFGFAPGQLTANAHKYVASYVLRCCALDRTPTLDEFLILFSLGGSFPFYSLYPHNHFPIFEKVEFKLEKWSLRYFVIEFLAHSPLDLPGVVLRCSISQTKFAAAELANKAPSAGRSNSVMSPSGSQSQGGSSALAVRKPAAALEVVPISAIPGLRKPTPSRNGHGKDKGTEAPSETERATETQRESEEQREPEDRRHATTPSAVSLFRRRFTPQTYPAFKEGWAGFSRGLTSLQASLWTIQANLEKMKESLREPTIHQTRPDMLALNVLYSLEQLKANGSTELAAERSRVQSLQEQVATYQRGTQDLEAQSDELWAQISILQSRASASENKVGSLEAGLVEKESRISELENSLQEAKHEGSRLNELAMKQMEARRLTLEKLKEERQIASELRSKISELEKTIAAHQEEVATLTARAEALYEERKFDMQQCMYEAVQSGLPENRSLDDFISYYGLPLPLSPPASRADPGP